MDVPTTIFNPRQLAKAGFILHSPYSRLSSLYPSEAEELAVVWAWSTARLAGNAYTYAEAECLLKDGITSIHKYEDAVILVHLHELFCSMLDDIRHQGRITVDADAMLDTYRRLVRGMDIPVAGDDLAEVSVLLRQADDRTHPLERAVCLYGSISKAKPFNAATGLVAHWAETAVMLNHDLIPIYVVRQEAVDAYHKATDNFVQTGSLTQYTDWFLDGLIGRINDIEPTPFQHNGVRE